MSRVCKLVGDIMSTEHELAHVKGDITLGDSEENFYSVPFRINGTEIPMLVSEYKLHLLQVGHVAVTGALMSIYQKKQVPRFFFSVNNIEIEEPDVQPTNLVEFVGTITNVRPLTHDTAGRDVFTITLSDISPLGETSVIYVAFRGPIARRYTDLRKGVKICGEGYLKPYRSTYEIYALSVNIL